MDGGSRILLVEDEPALAAEIVKVSSVRAGRLITSAVSRTRLRRLSVILIVQSSWTDGCQMATE